MSETPFPNPETTEFNPDAWGSSTTISEDEIAFLDNHFVRFPTTQPNVTFPVAPTVPTLAIATSDTRAASAQFVQNAKNTQTWGALQTFSAGMVTNAINPLTDGGTLTIGNGAVNNVVSIMSASNTGILTLGSSGSTTRINAPLTPLYSYPVAAGKIGEVFQYSGSVTPITFTPDVPLQIMSMTGFTAGTWLMAATVNRGTSAVNVYLSIALSTTTADVTSANALGIEYVSGAFAVGLISTLSCIVQVTSSSTVYYVNAQTGAGGTSTTITPILWRSVRLA